MRITSFTPAVGSEVTLPTAMALYDMGPAPAPGLTLATAGGVFDVHGTATAPQVFPHRLTFGAQVVDSTTANVDTTLATLWGLIGQRGVLTRIVYGDPDTEYDCDARVVAIPASRTVRTALAQPFQIGFDQLTPWRATSQNTDTAVFDTGAVSSPQTEEVTNQGNLTTPAVVISVTPTGASLTSITFEIDDVSGIKYDGTITTGQLLVIDCGQRTVTLDGSNVYANLEFTTEQTQSEWLPLAPGANDVIISWTKSGNPSISIAFAWYDWFA